MNKFIKHKSIKDRAIVGMIWSTVQKFGTMTIVFVSNLILARLLTPADFGSIGMLMVFISLSDTMIDGGFGSALIQRKSPTNTDYSTIFFWNIFLSIVLYLVLYASAPTIARFYDIAELSELLRVLGLVLIVSSFNVIQSNILVKQLNFRALARRDIFSAIVGATVGITMAYKGYGVWSLVGNTLVNGVTRSILLWNQSNWRPSWVFSLKSFKGLFKFGSFIFLSSMLDKLFTNLQTLIIGKVFSASMLGYYTQASRLERLPVQSVSSIVNQVSYPVFSSLQENLETLRTAMRKNIKAVVFLNYPMMVLLIVIAEPLITLLYTDKWLPSVPIFQVLSLAGMLLFNNTVNTNMIKSLGLSNLYFRMQLLKRIVALVILIIGLQFGFMGFIWSIFAYNCIYFVINALYARRVIGYGLGPQIRDSGLEYFLAFAVGAVVYYLFRYISLPNFAMILSQTAVYAVIYLSFAYLLRIEGLRIYTGVIKEQINKRRKKFEENN